MSASIDMLAHLGPLLGTLSDQGLLTSLQALEKQRQDELAQQVSQASQAAGTAGQAYQQAAQAPAPEVGGAAFIPTLFGNIASTLTQDPRFAQRAHERVAGQQNDLMARRQQNLQALRDIYDQKAQAAERLGNLDAAEKLRASHERVTVQLQKMRDQQDFDQALRLERERQKGAMENDKRDLQNRLAEIAATGAENRKTIASKPIQTGPERAALARQGIDPTTGFTLTTFAQREVTRRLALAKSRDEKTRNEAFNGMMEIAATRWSSDVDEGAMGRRLLRLQDPFYVKKGDQRYAVTGEKIWKKIKGNWIRDPQSEHNAKAQINDIVAPWFEGQ